MDTNQKEKKEEGNKHIDKMFEIWEKFNVFSTIEKDDTIPMMVGKVIVRIIGFIIMLILSPFVFLGFLLAFAAVS